MYCLHWAVRLNSGGFLLCNQAVSSSLSQSDTGHVLTLELPHIAHKLPFYLCKKLLSEELFE